jgi:hypothetical protein
MLVHQTVRALATRAIESRRAVTGLLAEQLTALVEGLQGMTVGTTPNSGGAPILPGLEGHNHGYGAIGLGLDCITSQGTLERGHDGQPCELVGRHIPKLLVHMGGSGLGRVSTGFLALADDAVTATNIHHHPLLDVRFVTDPGTIRVRVACVVMLDEFSSELPTARLRVAVGADHPMIAWRSDATDAGYVPEPFSERFAAESDTFSIGSPGVARKLVVPRVAVAPGRMNRLRIQCVRPRSSGGLATGLALYQISIVAEENDGTGGAEPRADLDP